MSRIELAGEKFQILETFNDFMTVPDCVVTGKNKLGKGNGEAKLYVANKDVMREFYGNEGFSAPCFVLKQDLISYMNAIKPEYDNPTQPYRGSEILPSLWLQRMQWIQELPDVIEFNIHDQVQIKGPRGYVNSKDEGYKVIRTLSLPLVSYISAMKLQDSSKQSIYYWKLFVDYEALSERKAEPLVYTYGLHKSKNKDAADKQRKKEAQKAQEINNARKGQGLYREKLIAECMYCPITLINDDRLLIASHIKPWASSTDEEKIDPKNGFLLSPMYDKLFDKGFITFTDDRHMKVSNWLSSQTIKRIGLEDDKFYQHLPIDEMRKKYLVFHRASVFKG